MKLRTIMLWLAGLGLAYGGGWLWRHSAPTVDRAAIPNGANPARELVADPDPSPRKIVHANPLIADPMEVTEIFTVTPLSGSTGERSFRFLSPDLEALHRGDLRVLSMKGQGRHAAGAPDLPVVATLLPGVPGSIPTLDIAEATFLEIPDVEIEPVPTPSMTYAWDGTATPRVVSEPDESIFGVDAYWPPELASVTEAWMGTQKVTRVEIRPVQYNPVTRTLRYVYGLNGTMSYAAELVGQAPLIAERDPDLRTSGDNLLDCPEQHSGPVLPAMNGDPEDFAVRRSGEEVDAIYKILLTDAGVYRVSQPELVTAGVPESDLVGDQIRLFHRDREVAIHTSTTGLMGATDYLLFFAEAFTGQHSLTNVYWLGTGGSGKRMSSRSSGPEDGGEDISSHDQRRTVAPNTFFADNVGPNNETWDHWRAAPLLSFPGSEVFTYGGSLDTPEALAVGDAKICVTLHGVAESDSFTGFRHNTEIKINDQVVHTVQWNGTGSFGGAPITDEATFPASMLTGTTTDFFLRQVLLPGNAAADQVYLESFTLTYPRDLKVVDDELHFAGESGDHVYRVEGISSVLGLWILDLDDPWQPVRITDYTSSPDSGFYQVRFRHNAAAPSHYWVGRDAAFKTIASITKTAIRGLGDPIENRADYLVICPDILQDEAYRLITNRHLRGEAVVVASPEDIYNEFSYGIKTTEGLKQFIGYAFHHWPAPAPQRVLLIGDASYDPNGYLNPTGMDLVPAHMGGTPFTYTSLDVWYTRVNGKNGGGGDILADLAIGRIPVRTLDALADVVDKILAYEAVPSSDPSRKRAVIVTGHDKPPALGFNDSGNDVASIMGSNEFTLVQQLYSPSVDSNLVLSAVNASPGMFALTYFGHGAHEFWDGGLTNAPSGALRTKKILSTEHLGGFTNTRLPIVTATTCINGYFADPDAAKEGFAESIVELPMHGAIAAIAGTALSQDAAASEIGCKFYQTLLTDEVRTLGEAMMGGYLGAFQTYGTSPELYFYQIIGDPGLVVNP